MSLYIFDYVIAVKGSWPHRVSDNHGTAIEAGEIFFVTDCKEKSSYYCWTLLGTKGLFNWYGRIHQFEENFAVL